MNSKSKDLTEWFLSRVQKSNGCWTWEGWRHKQGYGRLRVDGKCLMAHRVSYELHVGEIPDGMDVLHRCDNPMCVNPSHLFIGTHQDNMTDMAKKGRTRWGSGLRHGSKTKPEKVLRGEGIGNSKLSEPQALAILHSKEPVSELSKKYGVTKECIGCIKRRKTWRHLSFYEHI